MAAEISFRVNDGVSSFIEGIKQRSSAMAAEAIRDAQKQTNVAKEQLKLVEEKIRALERSNRLESRGAEAGIRQISEQRIITSQARVAALNEENKRRFSAGEITDDEFIRRRKRINRLAREHSEESITSEAEGRISSIREQERQQSLLVSYMRENVAAVTSSSRNQINAIRQGNENLIDAVDDSATPQEQLANHLASQQINQERERTESSKDWKKDMLTLANAITLEKVGGMVSNMPNAKNELDYIKPMMSTMGLVMGGLAGNLMDAANIKIFGNGLGNTNFGALGTQLGEKMGEFAGNSLERTYRSRDDLTTSNYRLKALSGRSIGEVEGFGGIGRDGSKLGGRGVIESLNQNMEHYGLSMKEVSQLQYDIAMRMGSSVNNSRTPENVVAMEKGWGVRQETSMAVLELLRSNRTGDRDITKIIGGILQKGQGGIFKDGDRTFLNEFLTRNYTQLQKTLLSTNSSVASGTAMDILKKFDSLGGEFGAKDSRSTGYINQIQQSLANPGSDSMKALSFYVMRKNNPEMSLSDTQIEIQKGMASPKYMQSMMKYLTEQGGDESYQINNVASAFGLQNNLAVAKRLLQGYKSGKLSTFSTKELSGSGEFSEDAARATAMNQTSPYARSTAEIENAFIQSATQGIGKVKEKMVGLFGDMVDELKVYIKNEIGVSVGTTTKIPQNTTWKKGGVTPSSKNW